MNERTQHGYCRACWSRQEICNCKLENIKMSLPEAYTKNDVGCYLDGARGVYLAEAVIEFAEGHGFKIDPCDSCDEPHSDWTADCEWIGEVADEATEYMNRVYPVDGAYWAFENGDWGLWLEDARQ